MKDILEKLDDILIYDYLTGAQYKEIAEAKGTITAARARIAELEGQLAAAVGALSFSGFTEDEISAALKTGEKP